jgi:tRNA G18 (ribose-2'-O)-methylase SpoU
LNTRLHRRGERTDARFVAEGDLVVMRAIGAGHVPELVVCDEAAMPMLEGMGDRLGDAQVVIADESTRKTATGLGVALSIVALFPKPPLVDATRLIARHQRIVVLAQVDNPTNVGAIVRSAAAFGFTGIVLDGESSDPYARRALRVAMGTTFGLDISRINDAPSFMDALDRAGFESYAMTPDPDARDLSTLQPTERTALILGSERDGLADDWMQAATHKVRIPMAEGVDSLNVAAAAAVACYGLTRRNG